MKLEIQRPCYNEADTLGVTLAALPRKLPGIDKIEWLIVDDGSTDETVEVAIKNGVDRIVRRRHNQGPAAGFVNGIKACLAHGADIIYSGKGQGHIQSLILSAVLLGMGSRTFLAAFLADLLSANR